MNFHKSNIPIQKTIRIDKLILAKIENLAKEENRSFNNMLETILIRELK